MTVTQVTRSLLEPAVLPALFGEAGLPSSPFSLSTCDAFPGNLFSVLGMHKSDLSKIHRHRVWTKPL